MRRINALIATTLIMMVNSDSRPDYLTGNEVSSSMISMYDLQEDHPEDSPEDPMFVSKLESMLSKEVAKHQFFLTNKINNSLHNETLALILSYLNTTGGALKEPVHPCDIGFHDGYQIIHGYLALLVCIVGSVSNALNIIILTRKEMVNSTNTILTGLAVADLLVLMEYSFFATTYISSTTNTKSFGHAVYILFHAHFSQVVHTIAICLTVTLAVWRYIAICKPHLNLVLCTLPRSRIAVAVAYILSPVLHMPNYLMLTINTRNRSGTKEYIVDFTEGAKNGRLQSVNFWLYSVLVKLIPCILLTVLIFHIIRAMYTAKRRKQNLMQMRTPSMDGVERRAPRMERLTEKTTRMLLTVLLLFLLTELPQGILSFLSGVYGHDFFKECYLHWGDFMDLLALLNSAVNFLLYYIMSQQFRLTLRKLLIPTPPQNISPRVQGNTFSTQL